MTASPPSPPFPPNAPLGDIEALAAQHQKVQREQDTLDASKGSPPEQQPVQADVQAKPESFPAQHLEKPG